MAVNKPSPIQGHSPRAEVIYVADRVLLSVHIVKFVTH